MFLLKTHKQFIIIFFVLWLCCFCLNIMLLMIVHRVVVGGGSCGALLLLLLIHLTVAVYVELVGRGCSGRIHQARDAERVGEAVEAGGGSRRRIVHEAGMTGGCCGGRGSRSCRHVLATRRDHRVLVVSVVLLLLHLTASRRILMVLLLYLLVLLAADLLSYYLWVHHSTVCRCRSSILVLHFDGSRVMLMTMMSMMGMDRGDGRHSVAGFVVVGALRVRRVTARRLVVVVVLAIVRHGRITGIARATTTTVSRPAVLLSALEALLTPQVAAVLKHVARLGMQRPVAALARSLRTSRHLDKAVVEAQRVSDRVLPALLILAVVGKQVHDELVDLAERAHAVAVVLYGHGDEADVGVGWLGVGHVSPVGRGRCARRSRSSRRCIRGRSGVVRERGRRRGRGRLAVRAAARCARRRARGRAGGARREEMIRLLLLLM